MVYFDIGTKGKDKKTRIIELSRAEEIEGKLKTSDKGLMKSVLESDRQTIEKGKLIESAMDRGINTFTPDLMFEQMVSDYKMAEQIYGERILRQLFGYDPEYIQKNIKIPEFRRLLRKKAEENLKKLSEEKIIDNKFNITDKGIELASLVMYTEELDNIVPKGNFGERVHKKASHYGEKEDVKFFRKGDRYKDIAIRNTIKTSIRRGHSDVGFDDLKAFERQSKGQCYIIYALDASGSMRGDKISSCKKAGIALAHKAISNRDKVGLIVFGDEIRSFVEPTLDFGRLIKEIVKVRASSQTDIVKTIKRSIELFPNVEATKHLILLSDALPTAGAEPEKETLEAVSMARNSKITVSVIGVNLDKKGEEMARKIAEVGLGKLYSIKDLKDVDKIVLEDYESVA